MTVQKPTLDEVFLALTGHGAEDDRTDAPHDRDPGGDPMTTTLDRPTRDAVVADRDLRTRPSRRHRQPDPDDGLAGD